MTDAVVQYASRIVPVCAAGSEPRRTLPSAHAVVRHCVTANFSTGAVRLCRHGCASLDVLVEARRGVRHCLTVCLRVPCVFQLTLFVRIVHCRRGSCSASVNSGWLHRCAVAYTLWLRPTVSYGARSRMLYRACRPHGTSYSYVLHASSGTSPPASYGACTCGRKTLESVLWTSLVCFPALSVRTACRIGTSCGSRRALHYLSSLVSRFGGHDGRTYSLDSVVRRSSRLLCELH